MLKDHDALGLTAGDVREVLMIDVVVDPEDVTVRDARPVRYEDPALDVPVKDVVVLPAHQPAVGEARPRDRRSLLVTEAPPDGEAGVDRVPLAVQQSAPDVIVSGQILLFPDDEILVVERVVRDVGAECDPARVDGDRRSDERIDLDGIARLRQPLPVQDDRQTVVRDLKSPQQFATVGVADQHPPDAHHRLGAVEENDRLSGARLFQFGPKRRVQHAANLQIALERIRLAVQDEDLLEAGLEHLVAFGQQIGSLQFEPVRLVAHDRG